MVLPEDLAALSATNQSTKNNVGNLVIFIKNILYTQLKTTFTFSSNIHLFKETRGHFYQFWETYINFWILRQTLN